MDTELSEEFCFILKLVNGETLLCNIIKDTENNVIVRDPFLMNTHTSYENQSQTMYFTDWFKGASSRVHMIRKDHILSASLPDVELKENYKDLVNIKSKRLEPLSKPKQNMDNFLEELTFRLKHPGRYQSQ